jgi:nucleoside-diphosphate-sugar epimerase
LEYGDSAAHYDFIPANAALQPNTLYGASKAAASVALCAHARITHSELFYGRIFHAYGEGQHKGNFWPSLCQAALSGQDFIMTSGRQMRDFIPVESIASQLLTACGFADLRPGQPCLANLGSGTPVSLADFATQEWNRLGAKGRLLVGGRPDRPGEIHRYVPSLDPFFLTFPSAS